MIHLPADAEKPAVKKLYVLRHAKSDWNEPAAGDHQRPLAKRGVKAAELMGRFLRSVGQVPDAVATSSAVRARTTVELMARAGDWTCPVHVTRTFYESRPEDVLRHVRTFTDEHESLMLAGHEPTWSALVQLLSGARVRMVTAALARIDLGVDRWADVEPGSGVLVWLVPPKLLERAGGGGE